ncbi:MAG: sugar transferase, partial [Lysobacteraceae bacterium]
MLQKADGETEFQRLHAGAKPISKQTRRFQLYALLALFDVAAILLAFLAAGLLRSEPTFGANGLRLALMISPIYVLVASNGQAFGYQSLLNWKRGLGKALGALAFAIAAVLFV